jgi:hypothetical protein
MNDEFRKLGEMTDLELRPASHYMTIPRLRTIGGEKKNLALVAAGKGFHKAGGIVKFSTGQLKTLNT